MCVHKKKIHQDIFNFKQYNFQLKYLKSIIHNISISSEKVTSSEPGEKYAQIKPRLQVKTVQNSYMLHTTNIFSLFYYWSWTCILAICWRMDLFLKKPISFSQDINWWTGVEWFTCELLWCFYQLFGLSFWRHPFTAEDPLVKLSDGMLRFSKSLKSHL